MISSRTRDNSRLGPIDYGLVAAGSCCAAYSAGMAVAEQDVALFFVYTILIGTAFSLGVRAFIGRSSIVRIDAFLYAIAAIGAVWLSPRLNVILPNDGIPAEVVTAGWLSWMLAFGSFLTWRDGTLLFQAVPTIALFGLVGCYDTFAAAPWFFFAFLLCLATMLARAHSREMLRQAVESGYFNRADAPNAPTEFPEQSPELFEDIRKGPWRWVAGPGWALLSGLGIVLVSLIGAPKIRSVMLPLSGVIHVDGPHFRQKRAASALPNTPDITSSYEVGRGPLINYEATPIQLYSVKFDHVRYLRTGVFNYYDGHTWTIHETFDTEGLQRLGITEIRSPKKFAITIQGETASRVLPLPGETTQVISGNGGIAGEILGDAGAVLIGPTNVPVTVQGVDSQETPKDADKDSIQVRPYLNIEHLEPNVKAFADKAVKSEKSDYDRAEALLRAIGQQCRYSTRASAVPEGEDSIEYFLMRSRVGYCDLFASAMVMTARAEGIPARYVIGYLPDEAARDTQNNTIVTDHDYHAWAELFFKNVGWVVFDATSGAQTLNDSQNAAKQIWSGVLPSLLDALIAIGVVSLILLWLRPSLMKIGVKKSHRSEVDRQYVLFARALQRASGRKRNPAETPDEYLAAVKPFLNGASEAAERVNATLIRAMYSTDSDSERELPQLRIDVKQFAKMSTRGPDRERHNQSVEDSGLSPESGS